MDKKKNTGCLPKVLSFLIGVFLIAFGIGTYISNDTDISPLNIVMKVVECNEGPVAKLSNSEGKTMCKDNEYVEYLKKSIEWRLNHQ